MTKVKCYVSVQVTYLLDIHNNRRVFVGSIGSDCNPIRTAIQSNWLILFFSGTGSRSDSNPIMIRSYPQ